MKAIYKAVRDRRLIVGTAEQIGAETGYSANKEFERRWA